MIVEEEETINYGKDTIYIIEILRSDLNMVVNTQDLIVYDVDNLIQKFENMDAELKNVENSVQSIQKK